MATNRRERGRVVHVTTTDISLDLLLGPQLRAIRDAGYEVIAASAPGRHVARLDADGIRHIPLRHATRSVAPVRDVRAFAELHRLFRELDPDIVHTHNPKPGVYGRLAAGLAGVPAIVNTQHGLYATPGDAIIRRALVFGLERLAALCSDAELVQNEEDLATLARLGVPRRKLHLLGNGIDLTRFDPAAVDPHRVRRLRAEAGAGPETVLVGTVGRLVRAKGYHELFDVVETVSRRLPDIRFVVAGPEDPGKADAVSRAEMDRARDRGVVFLGMVDDMVTLYGALDLYVLASHREGFSRSAMEASAMGLPVLATDIRGCRQVVDDGVTGRLTPVRDSDALAAAVVDLAGDPETIDEMGRAARRKARAEFDQQRVIDTTLGVYEALLGHAVPRTRRRGTGSTGDGHDADARLRVLWLIKGLGPGGAERLLVNHAAVADHDRFRYRAAFVAAEKDHLVPDLEAHGVPVTLLEANPGWSWPLRLRRLLRRSEVDVVHVHSPAVAAVARVVIRSLGRRRPAVVYTEHNEWGKHRWLTRRLNSLTFGLDDAHLAVSRGVRASMGRRHRRRLPVLVHGVDGEEVRAAGDGRASARAALGVGEDEVVVGTVANLRTEKGYDTLIAAARTVLDRRPECRFVAIGHGPLEATVREWHRRHELGERFSLLGYRPDAVALMGGFDLFVLSSNHEGLPVALMEAMVLGLPVVASAVGGLPEAVDDGVQGLLVPPGRPDLLAAAIIELVDDPGRREQMAAAAAERGADFDIFAAVRRLESLYQAVARRAS